MMARTYGHEGCWNDTPVGACCLLCFGEPRLIPRPVVWRHLVCGDLVVDGTLHVTCPPKALAEQVGDWVLVSEGGVVGE